MKTFTGLNIQYPISQLILEGKKIIETRTYPLPQKYLGKELVIIETPGKDGDFESRIVGIIKFDECFKYRNKEEFYGDKTKHFVLPDSPWRWSDRKPKWGWKISYLRVFKHPKIAPKKKGIVYTKDIKI